MWIEPATSQVVSIVTVADIGNSFWGVIKIPIIIIFTNIKPINPQRNWYKFDDCDRIIVQSLCVNFGSDNNRSIFHSKCSTTFKETSKPPWRRLRRKIYSDNFFWYFVFYFGGLTIVLYVWIRTQCVLCYATYVRLITTKKENSEIFCLGFRKASRIIR